MKPTESSLSSAVFLGDFMKLVFILAAFLSSVAAFCAESVTTSHFHLFSSKCESEAEQGPDSTPQSPPLNVDDPGTPGCNRWEINFVASGDFSRSGRDLELPLLDLNYGIGDNLQLKYEVPYASRGADGESVSAIGESKVGIKHKFFENEESGIELALYPQVSFIGSNSDAV